MDLGRIFVVTCVLLFYPLTDSYVSPVIADQGGEAAATLCTIARGAMLPSNNCTPTGHRVVPWYPLSWQYVWTDSALGALDDNLCGGGQGYSFTPYVETAWPNPSPSICTAEHFIALIRDPTVAVLAISSHGVSGVIQILSYEKSPQGYARAVAAAHTLNQAGITADVSDGSTWAPGDANWGVWIVLPNTAPPFGNLMLPGDPIVMLGACESYPESAEAFVLAGARAASGFSGSPLVVEIDNSFSIVANCLNGRDPTGYPTGDCPTSPGRNNLPVCFRSFANACMHTDRMLVTGSPEVTMNPAVLSVTHDPASDPLYPLSIGEKIVFRFDTHCDTSTSPIANVLAGGSGCNVLPLQFFPLELGPGVWLSSTELSFPVEGPTPCEPPMIEVYEYIVELPSIYIRGENNLLTALDGNVDPKTVLQHPMPGSDVCDCPEHFINAVGESGDAYIYDPFCLYDFGH